MWHGLRAAIEVVYGPTELFSGISSVAYTALVFAGGLAIWWFISWILEYLVLRAERATIWIYSSFDNGKTFRWNRRRRTFGASFAHLILQCIFMIGVILIFWISCASSGFNPWTTGAATLGMSIFLTYVFMTPLGLLGSGMAVLATGLIAPDQYWEFPGHTGYGGRIIAIYTFQVELERWDEESQSAEIIAVPINMFLSSVAKRNMNKEASAARVTRTDVQHSMLSALTRGTLSKMIKEI